MAPGGVDPGGLLGEHRACSESLLPCGDDGDCAGPGGSCVPLAEALVDIDGDNLPDKVFADGGGLFYRPNTSGPDAGPEVTFGDRRPLPGLRTISEESTDTFCVGPELFPGVQILNRNAWTWAEQPAYLADANGDGLVDLMEPATGSCSTTARVPTARRSSTPTAASRPCPWNPAPWTPPASSANASSAGTA